MRWLAILALSACIGTGDYNAIDAEHVRAHVDALATGIGPRPGDSATSRAALSYIEGELDKHNIPHEQLAVGGVDLPAIEVLGKRWRDAKHLDTTDPDLLVRLGPPGPALLIMAHYDTVPSSPGAVDNAAAVGLLIELAQRLHDHAPAQRVILAFTANEERGLVGAEALAAHGRDDIALAISLDLVGGSGPLVLNGASSLINGGELRWLARGADRAGVALRTPLPQRVISRWWPQAERSDHGAFTRRGVRAIHFYDRGQDGEWIDLAYHSPADVPDRVDRSSLIELGNLLAALADEPVPSSDNGDAGVWLPLAANTVVPRWALIAFEIVLAFGALAAIVLGAARSRRDRQVGGAGLADGLVCYAVAVAATIGFERLTAGDHPAPWLHEPLRAEVAEMLVLVGVLGLMTRLIARRWMWIGRQRYLAVAIALPLVVGVFWLAVGAAELAWIWLVPAALAALAPRLGRLAPIAIAGTLLPAVLVLAPPQMREAAWNGFLPMSLPLGAWLGLLVAPTLAAGAWWLRRPAGPLGTLVLALGCALAAMSGLAVGLTGAPSCSGSEFQRFHLACELPPTWR